MQGEQLLPSKHVCFCLIVVLCGLYTSAPGQVHVSLTVCVGFIIALSYMHNTVKYLVPCGTAAAMDR